MARVQAGGGGIRSIQIGNRVAMCTELWSTDEETGDKVGFVGAHDAVRHVLYMQMCTTGADPEAADQESVQAKSAIRTLLDLADALHVRKLTVGLGIEHAGCPELVCSYLHLGFQVAPSTKSPLRNCVLLLDLDIQCEGVPFLPSSSDHGFTGTSDCSTSADDDTSQSVLNDSENSEGE